MGPLTMCEAVQNPPQSMPDKVRFVIGDRVRVRATVTGNSRWDGEKNTMRRVLSRCPIDVREAVVIGMKTLATGHGGWSGYGEDGDWAWTRTSAVHLWQVRTRPDARPLEVDDRDIEPAKEV